MASRPLSASLSVVDVYADRWALVTGASSGIGAEFARLLAGRGMHLVLAARREAPMKELAAELFTRHGTRTEIVSADLVQPPEIARLAEEIDRKGIEIELLVNNAGFGVVADVPNTSRESVLDMISVNIAALTDLTYRFLPPMIERKHGGIINVASVAAFQPVAYMGAYAASKAYVLHFSEALWAETRDHGVTVIALCPGVTNTSFFDVAGAPGWLKKTTASEPEQVVRSALRALEKKRNYVVPGWKNYILSLLVRLAPRRTCALESRKYFRPRPQKKDKQRIEAG
ncbi:MAG: SDR family oxidoreductase [Planctomycetota bacterium]|nr:SDR family oxidoreductase [Planctomycetaceae bacterium]MDQ3333172.1 SDR family oxidoreductase [Planctomycetota bacterium]